MQFRLSSLLALALAAPALATWEIVSPGPDVWWVANSINTLTWSCNDPQALANPTFTVLVANSNVNVLTSPIAIIGIENNYVCSQTITADQLSAPAGTGYTILFANTLNETDVYLTSQPFEIKALGSTYPTSTPAISGSSSASSTPSGTASGGNAAASASTTAKSSGAIKTGAAGGVLALVAGVMGLVL